MALVPQKLRKGWQSLRRGEPGSRFQDHFHRRQESGGGRLRKWLYLGGGTLVILAGLFFLPAPGPGFLILLVGGGLIAQESLLAARALDWIEVRLRAVVQAALRIWKGASTPVRVLIVILAAAVVGGAAYGAFWLMFGR